MPIDPAAGFPLDPNAAIRERLRDIERAVRANPGAQAAYDEELGTVGTSSAAYVDLGGPVVSLYVPERGAFVNIYAELEGRDVTASGAPAQAAIYEATDFPAGASRLDFNVGAAFTLRRLLPAATGASGAAGASDLGLFGTYWATPGIRTYSLRYRHNLGAAAEFRNRRLWARVAY